MDIQKSEEYVNNLFEAVSLIIDKKISQINFDQTLRCYLQRNSNGFIKKDGEYLVQYGALSFYATPTGTIQDTDKIVYVLVPMGDFSQKKFIVSKESSNSSTVIIPEGSSTVIWETF